MKSFQYISREMTSPEVIELPQGKITVFSRSSPTKTSGNEDCAQIISLDDDTSILMVADGMGGHANGAAASAILTEVLEESVSKKKSNARSIRETILRSIEKANLNILRKNTGEGSTVAIAEINKNRVRTYHVGDSEIYITDEKGNIKLQTISHSPVGYAMEAGFIQEGAAITHDERHIISNYVGRIDMHIDMGSPASLNKYDTLVLGTDGLFDNLLKQEVIDIVRKGPLESLSEDLWNLAAMRMNEKQDDFPSKPDDMTFILYQPR
ncbi:MAG: serine/threonine protein phosphatase PrpC [Gammaproteobacteria bacterium]|jgi:serine/threonine protein phosphatase PrpC